MYRLTYNIYDRAGAFTGSQLEVEDSLVNLLNKNYPHCTTETVEVEVKYKPRKGVRIYSKYIETGHILNHQQEKVGHYTITLE